jgi:hypothetical protein
MQCSINMLSSHHRQINRLVASSVCLGLNVVKRLDALLATSRGPHAVLPALSSIFSSSFQKLRDKNERNEQQLWAVHLLIKSQFYWTLCLAYAVTHSRWVALQCSVWFLFILATCWEASVHSEFYSYLLYAIIVTEPNSFIPLLSLIFVLFLSPFFCVYN